MKKLFALLLVIIIIFSFTACGEKNNDSSTVTDNKSQGKVEPIPEKNDTGVKFKRIVKGYALDTEGRIWSYSLVDELKVFCDATKFASIFESNGYKCAIDENGGLWTWGQNKSGQLGDGTTTDRDTPQKILDDVKMAVGNYGNGYAIKIDGTFYQWGEGNSATPTSADVNAKFDYVAAGGSLKACVALDNDGNRYIWGANCIVLGCKAVQIDPALANAPNGAIPSKPTLVQNDTAAKGTYYFGSGTSYLIDSNGTLYISGGKGSRLEPFETTPSLGKYEKVTDNVTMIVPSMYGTLYVDTDGNIWGWGSDAFKICAATTKPVQITTGIKFVDVAILDSGSVMAYAVADDGNIYTFGEKNSTPKIVEPIV